MPVPTQKEKEIYELQKKYQRLDKQLKRLYGIGIEQYNQMWQGQDGLCAICGRHQIETARSLSVDHNHKTGEIRQLLCTSCNTVLGHIQDDIQTAKDIVAYLEFHEKRH